MNKSKTASIDKNSRVRYLASAHQRSKRTAFVKSTGGRYLKEAKQ